MLTTTIVNLGRMTVYFEELQEQRKYRERSFRIDLYACLY